MLRTLQGKTKMEEEELFDTTDKVCFEPTMKNMDEKRVAWTSNSYLNITKNFSLVQNRVVHFMVKLLQEEMIDMKKNSSLTKTPKGDCYFRIPATLLDVNRNTHSIIKAIEGMMVPLNTKDHVGNFIYAGRRKGDSWEILMGPLSVAILLEMSKGLTPIETTINIKAKSNYTLKLYMLLKQAVNNKARILTPEEVVEKLDMPPSLASNITRLKLRIEEARAEMSQLFDNEECDIYFTWEVSRFPKTKRIEQFRFDIYEGKNVFSATRLKLLQVFEIEEDANFIFDLLHDQKKISDFNEDLDGIIEGVPEDQWYTNVKFLLKFKYQIMIEDHSLLGTN